MKYKGEKNRLLFCKQYWGIAGHQRKYERGDAPEDIRKLLHADKMCLGRKGFKSPEHAAKILQSWSLKREGEGLANLLT